MSLYEQFDAICFRDDSLTKSLDCLELCLYNILFTQSHASHLLLYFWRVGNFLFRFILVSCVHCDHILLHWKTETVKCNRTRNSFSYLTWNLVTTQTRFILHIATATLQAIIAMNTSAVHTRNGTSTYLRSPQISKVNLGRWQQSPRTVVTSRV